MACPVALQFLLDTMLRCHQAQKRENQGERLQKVTVADETPGTLSMSALATAESMLQLHSVKIESTEKRLDPVQRGFIAISVRVGFVVSHSKRKGRAFNGARSKKRNRKPEKIEQVTYSVRLTEPRESRMKNIPGHERAARRHP